MLYNALSLQLSSLLYISEGSLPGLYETSSLTLLSVVFLVYDVVFRVFILTADS